MALYRTSDEIRPLHVLTAAGMDQLETVMKAFSSTRLRAVRWQRGRLAEAWDKGGNGSRRLGLIGIDLFAPNDLSLRFFTVGPFNE
jgi:hypothetical protein